MMNEGQPVTVVGNLAQLGDNSIRDNSQYQMNEDTNVDSIYRAVGHPVEPGQPHRVQQNTDFHATHHVPINHVSDYDILDLDLAGLKQLSKTGIPMDNIAGQFDNDIPEGNYPQQITEGEYVFLILFLGGSNGYTSCILLILTVNPNEPKLCWFASLLACWFASLLVC